MNEDPKLSNAFFGGGCFWCIEAAFSDLKGVSKVESGYSGGSEVNANYKSVSAGITNHAEICKITYDPKKISYETLVKIFFTAHDPTTYNRQGNDIGPQYRSIIFFNKKNEFDLIEKIINEMERDGIYEKIVTETEPFQKFYKAEDYHQNYYENNPKQPYCSYVIKPKLQKLRKQLKQFYN